LRGGACEGLRHDKLSIADIAAIAVKEKAATMVGRHGDA
jgi:hypothetical protein